MTRTNKQAFHTPIMGIVSELIEYVFRVRTIPCVEIQKVEVQTLRKNCDILYMQAMREVRGNRDYANRILETVESIQAEAYMINRLHGWSNRVASTIDAKCDEIAEEIYKIKSSAKSQNHDTQG